MLSIYVNCDDKIFVDPRVTPYNKIRNRIRFLDDIWTAEMFQNFIDVINKVDCNFGITFTGTCGKSFEFLDVSTSLKA